MLSWTLHLKSGPNKEGQAAVAVGDKVYLIGEARNDSDDHIDVHIFHTVSLRWRKLTPVTTGGGGRHPEVPSSRCSHTAVLIEDTIYSGAVINITHINTATFFMHLMSTPTDGPSPRFLELLQFNDLKSI